MRTKSKEDFHIYHRHSVKDAGLANKSLKWRFTPWRLRRSLTYGKYGVLFAARREFTKRQNETLFTQLK